MIRDFSTWRLRDTPGACFVCFLAVVFVVGCSNSKETGSPSPSGREAPTESVTGPDPPPPVQPSPEPSSESSGEFQSDQPSEIAINEGADETRADEETQPAAKSPGPIEGRGSLDAALADLKIPPDWFDRTEINYDTNQPWKEARLEIRRLLGLGGETGKQGVKLTCLYRDKNDIGDGHEYPMYLYMGGEYAWATKAYEEFTQELLADPDSFDHIHAFLCLASCYSHFDEFQKALATLDTAMTRLPGPPWRIARQADIHDSFGDVYAKMGQTAEAKEHYAEAARLYPQSNQPYGGHLLKRRAAKIQSKLDLLDYRSLRGATLKDGTYKANALGYSGDKDLAVTLTVSSGKIADIKIDHAEKIDQGATTIIPQRIIDRQSLEVDTITGATITCDGIRDCVFRALKQAGLE